MSYTFQSPQTYFSPISPYSQFSPISPVNHYSHMSPVSPFSPRGQIIDHVSIRSQSPFVIRPNGPINNMPFEMNVDLTYAPELVPLYENISKHPRVINRTTKYFYYKTLDKWLRKDEHGLMHLLGYMTIQDGSVSLITKLDDYNEDAYLKDSKEDIDLKVKYIETNVLSQKNLSKVLIKYSDDININTYDLFKVEKFVRAVIGNHIKTMIKKMIIRSEQ